MTATDSQTPAYGLDDKDSLQTHSCKIVTQNKISAKFVQELGCDE